MSELRCWKLFMYHFGDGRLLSPWGCIKTYWDSPLLKAHYFEPRPHVTHAPGVHALRFGENAWPQMLWYAVGECVVPPSTRAVLSPWALRAERLLLVKLRLVDLTADTKPVVDRWSKHCQIQYAHQQPDVCRAFMRPDSPFFHQIGVRWDWDNGFAEQSAEGELLASWWDAKRRQHSLSARLDDDGVSWEFGVLHHESRVQWSPEDDDPVERARRARQVLRQYLPAEVASCWCEFLDGIESGLFDPKRYADV